MYSVEERDARIKACLRSFTCEFGSTDVKFLQNIHFPCRVVFTRTLRPIHDIERNEAYLVDGLDDLEVTIKRFINLCNEQAILEIDNEGQGRLILTRMPE